MYKIHYFEFKKVNNIDKKLYKIRFKKDLKIKK